MSGVVRHQYANSEQAQRQERCDQNADARCSEEWEGGKSDIEAGRETWEEIVLSSPAHSSREESARLETIFLPGRTHTYARTLTQARGLLLPCIATFPNGRFLLHLPESSLPPGGSLL